MKKFDRLPPEKRREEIKTAAAGLFNEKGFAKTTMENIVERVSLSKGGVYRLYSSTIDILSDIILDGMTMRNAYYEEAAKNILSSGRQINIEDIIDMISQSLFIYPQISNIYVEFLWEKRRNKKLSELYDEICEITVKKTLEIINKYCGDSADKLNVQNLKKAEILMNSAILSINILNLENDISEEKICESIKNILKMNLI